MRPFTASLIEPLPHGPRNIHTSSGMRSSDAYVPQRARALTTTQDRTVTRGQRDCRFAFLLLTRESAS